MDDERRWRVIAGFGALGWLGVLLGVFSEAPHGVLGWIGRGLIVIATVAMVTGAVMHLLRGRQRRT